MHHQKTQCHPDGKLNADTDPIPISKPRENCVGIVRLTIESDVDCLRQKVGTEPDDNNHPTQTYTVDFPAALFQPITMCNLSSGIFNMH